ncbi:MAG: phosphoribosyltransferase family protein [Chloroflexota bacterium]
MSQPFLELLSAQGIARRGHFRLESGHHGDVWLDLDALFRSPALLRPFIDSLASGLVKACAKRSSSIEAVCGPLTGGAFLAYAIAAALEVGFYYTIRQVPPQPQALYAVPYRLPQGLRQAVRGKRVVIVDDAINAGSAVRGTLAELRTCGALPLAVGALLVLGQAAPDFFAGQALPLVCVVDFPANLWLPEACPLCASQTPLEDLLV